jgi:hypothetical protein
MLPPSLLGAEVVAGRVDAGDARDLPPGGRVSAGHRAAVVALPGVATFAVEHGARVVVDVAPEASERALAAWLHGLVAALLLAQRGEFALHANLVVVRGAAIALAGERGAGKTTASLRLAQRGAALGGDDVLPLAVDGDAVVHTTTGRPLRVDRRTAATLGWDVSGTDPSSPADGKLLLDRPAIPPGALKRVVVVGAAPVSGVEVERASGAEAARLVRANAYRPRLLGRVWAGELFAWAAAVAGRVPVHVLRRPGGRWSADEVAAALERLA